MVIPLRDENPTRRTPIVTIVLIAVNLVVFFALQLPKESKPSDYIGGLTEEDEFNYEYAAIPCELREAHPLNAGQLVSQQCDTSTLNIGGRSQQEVFPDKNIWLAVLFSMFMHGSVLHVLGNMLFLWIFGNNVEDRLGPVWFLLFYLMMGIAAAGAHVAFNADSVAPLIGAVRRNRRRHGCVHRLVPARARPQPGPDLVLLRLHRTACRRGTRHLVRHAVLHEPERRHRLDRVRRWFHRRRGRGIRLTERAAADAARAAPAAAGRGRRDTNRNDDDWGGGFRGGYPGRQ